MLKSFLSRVLGGGAYHVHYPFSEGDFCCSPPAVSLHIQCPFFDAQHKSLSFQRLLYLLASCNFVGNS